MNALADFVARGGSASIAIMALSVVLYGRCFNLLLRLRRASVGGAPDGTDAVQKAAWRQRQQAELREHFRHERVTLGCMIAAAPLLGLLGTVSGMVTIFETLSIQGGQQSMEGLAGGISEVLTATQSGLAVALPAMLLVYLAHRQLMERLRELNREDGFPRGGVQS